MYEGKFKENNFSPPTHGFLQQVSRFRQFSGTNINIPPLKQSDFITAVSLSLLFIHITHSQLAQFGPTLQLHATLYIPP